MNYIPVGTYSGAILILIKIREWKKLSGIFIFL